MCAPTDAVAAAAASGSDCGALSFAIAIVSHDIGAEATEETLGALFCVSVPPPSAPLLSALSYMKLN